MMLADFMVGLGKVVEEYRDENWPDGPDDYRSISVSLHMGPEGRVSFSYSFFAPEAKEPKFIDPGVPAAGQAQRP